MEIKIPKELRTYRESVFFGLSLRQFACSVIAVIVAVICYFGLRKALGQEMVSWVCMFCAAPFAAAGFFSYNSMNLEQFLIAWVRSQFLCAGPRKFKSEILYMKLLEEARTMHKGRRPGVMVRNPRLPNTPAKKKTCWRKEGKRP